ncbi:MAG TPA: LacI family DNA-binding transcriptional regulator [Cyclobacteriaceae bacterium]
MPKKTSISDIAKAAGVSIASVSYVLNGMEKEKRVSQRVAEKIRATASYLNYQPSHIARSLRQGSTKTLGLVVADIANEFFGNLAKSIEVEAYNKGYSVIFGSSDEDPVKSKMLSTALVNRQVDGLIITPVGDPYEHMEKLSKQLPLVMVDRFVNKKGFNYVKLDNLSATYDATKHLFESGYRKIGIIGYDSQLLHILDRYQGYIDALKEFLPDKKPIIGTVRYDNIAKDIAMIMDEYIKNNLIDSIIFATNSLTVGGLYYCQKNKVLVPDQLAIIGFDGNYAFDFFYAPLTYIKQPIKEMGIAAVNILLKKMGHQVVSEQKEFQHKLIIRQSA